MTTEVHLTIPKSDVEKTCKKSGHGKVENVKVEVKVTKSNVTLSNVYDIGRDKDKGRINTGIPHK